MAIGFLLFLWTLRRLGRGTHRNSDYISNLLTLLVLSALGGARALYVAENWTSQFAAHPWQVLNVHQGGLVFYGGLLTAWVTMTLFAIAHHESYLDFLDFVITALPIGHAVGRVGCFLEGCCFGKVTNGPLGVVYPTGSHVWAHQVREGIISRHALHPLPVYPSQLFESALLLVVFFLLVRHYPKRRKGEQVALYAMLYATARFILETFRDDPRSQVGPFTISQFISLLLFAFGAGLMTWIHTRRKDAA